MEMTEHDSILAAIAKKVSVAFKVVLWVYLNKKMHSEATSFYYISYVDQIDSSWGVGIFLFFATLPKHGNLRKIYLFSTWKWDKKVSKAFYYS